MLTPQRLLRAQVLMLAQRLAPQVVAESRSMALSHVRLRSHHSMHRSMQMRWERRIDWKPAQAQAWTPGPTCATRGST
jgi:hypothetical protein